MYQFTNVPIWKTTYSYCYTDRLLYCYMIEKITFFQLPLHILVLHRYKGYIMHIFYPASEVP